MVEPKETPELSDTSFESRQQVYAELRAANSSETSPEEEGTDTLESEEKPEEEEKETTETSPEEEGTDTLESEEKPEDKTVPLGALHESRAETRAAKARITKLEEQLSEVIGNFKTLAEQKKEPEATFDISEPIDDTDEAIQILRKQNADLAAKFKDFSTQQIAEKQAMQVSEQDRIIKKTDAELAKEGYSGFNKFAWVVGEEIGKITDPDEKAAFQNQEGWKKIYKERVYPSLKTMFTSKDQKEKFLKKDEAAAKADLISNSGKVKKSAPKVKNNTYEDYLEMRTKNQVF